MFLQTSLIVMKQMSKWTEMLCLFCSVPGVFFSQYRCGSHWWGIGSRAADLETSGRNTTEPRPGWCYRTNPPETRWSSTPRLPTEAQSYSNNPIMLLWAHKDLICRNKIWQHIKHSATENHRMPQKTIKAMFMCSEKIQHVSQL